MARRCRHTIRRPGNLVDLEILMGLKELVNSAKVALDMLYELREGNYREDLNPIIHNLRVALSDEEFLGWEVGKGFRRQSC